MPPLSLVPSLVTIGLAVCAILFWFLRRPLAIAGGSVSSEELADAR